MCTRIRRFGAGVVALAASAAIGLVGGLASEAKAQQQFANFTTVTVPATGTSGISTPYPSSISVAGLKRGVAHVSVEIFSFSHTFPADVGVLLVGPGGQTCQLMGRCGNGDDASGAYLTFDDDAAAGLPAVITSGVYRPTTCFGAAYDAPAPAGPYGATLSVFNATNGNGKWSLFVQDFAGADVGQLFFGWRLSIIEAGCSTVVYSGSGMTIPAGAPTTTSGPSSLYPSNINVSGLTGKITGVGVRFNNLTHTFTADLDMLLRGPNGDTCMVMSDAGGGNPGVTGINIGFTHNATLAVGSPPLDATTYRPTDVAPGDTMPGSAPAGPYGATFAGFNGKDPNGTWSLFVNDDVGGDVGSLGSWELLIYMDERCPADFNRSGTLEVQDIFDFINSWLAGCP